MIYGQNPLKESRPVQTDSTGKLLVGDDADGALGTQADAAATTDTGTFSLIALTKRLLAKITGFSDAPGTAPTNAVAVQQVAPKTFTATIANGASLSGAVDLGTMRPGRMTLPAAWTAAAGTFAVSADGVTYGPLYDWAGTEVSIASASMVASREIVLDPTLFLSVRYLKVRSGTNGAPVNQGAARAIVVTGV